MYLLDRLQPDSGLDTALGKPQGQSSAPWFALNPDDTWRKRVQDKSVRVGAQQAKFTQVEIQEILSKILRGA